MCGCVTYIHVCVCTHILASSFSPFFMDIWKFSPRPSLWESQFHQPSNWPSLPPRSYLIFPLQSIVTRRWAEPFKGWASSVLMGWDYSSLTRHTGSLWLSPACTASSSPTIPPAHQPRQAAPSPPWTHCFHALLLGWLQAPLTPPPQWGLPWAPPALREMNLVLLCAPAAAHKCALHTDHDCISIPPAPAS